MTIKMLENIVKRLNEVRGFKTKTMEYNESKGCYVSNPNVYYISQAYGGYRLEQICSNGKGSKDITIRTTKKTLYELINMLHEGYCLAQNDAGVTKHHKFWS